MRSYKHLFKGENPNPDNEVIRQIKLVKSRVSEIFERRVRQEYDKFLSLKGLK